MQRGSGTRARIDSPGEATAVGWERKQRWKEQPGNRYSPEELRVMSETIDRILIVESEFHVMRLD